MLGLLLFSAVLQEWPDLRALLTTQGDGLGRGFCYPHYTGEESGAEKAQESWPRSQDWVVDGRVRIQTPVRTLLTSSDGHVCSEPK